VVIGRTVCRSANSPGPQVAEGFSFWARWSFTHRPAYIKAVLGLSSFSLAQRASISFSMSAPPPVPEIN
jgi:hypothetical protein